MPERSKWLIILFIVVNIISIEITTEDLKSAWNYITTKVSATSHDSGDKPESPGKPSIEDKTKTLLNKAQRLYDAKDYKEAVETYSEVIRLNPKHYVAYNNRGNTYKRLNQYDKALADYSQAIYINPKYAEAYYNRGWIYQARNNEYKAQADFASAKELGYYD